MSKRTVSTAVVCLFVFIVIAIYTLASASDTLNESLANAVHSWETPALTGALRVVTTFGEWFAYAPVVVVLIALPKQRWKAGVPAAVMLAASGVLNFALKQAFAIPRPDTHRLIIEPGFGFPSGHAMAAAAFAGLCALLFIRYSSSKIRKIAVSILAVVFVLAVGLSRVYLGVHTPTDVVAGYAMGLFLCLVTLCVMDMMQRRKELSAQR
jgi:undecaprenyl-diphosphatase